MSIFHRAKGGYCFNRSQLGLLDMIIMKKKEYPYCFGIIENVFPNGEDGLRHTPENCFVCIYKTECLRAAMEKSGGLKMQEEQVDRAYQSGMIGFLERWSRKKNLNRKIKNSEEK